MLKNWMPDSGDPLIVAEIAQSHDGSLGACHAYVDALADVGAHAIKFQTHIASAESTQDDQFRVRFSRQDTSRYAYWKRMEFTEEQWLGLKRHADERGILFLSTPFSTQAVQLLERIGVSMWKIGSGDTASPDMMEPMIASGKPIIISTGMSPWSEIDRVVERLRHAATPFCLMQCTTKYPTPLSDVGLNVLAEMKARYGCRVGLSDHSGSLAPAMTAVARGFNLVEIHATFDRRMFGPDVSSSLTVDEIGTLARFAEAVAVMDGSPVDKDAMAADLAQQKSLFGRSVATNTNLPKGHVIRDADLVPKKPGTGIPWAERNSLVGRVLKNETRADRLLRLEDLE